MSSVWQALHLINLLLAVYNYKNDPPAALAASHGTGDVAANHLFLPDFLSPSNLSKGIQICVVLLQISLGLEQHKVRQQSEQMDTDNRQQTSNQISQTPSYLSYIFTEKNKSYLRMMEKLVKGLVELSKAFAEFEDL